MKSFLAGLIFLAILLTACGGDAAIVEKLPQDYVSEYGGVLDVYTRILSLADCEQLQIEFNQADENNSQETPGTALFKATLGYMVASDERMQGIGCYE